MDMEKDISKTIQRIHGKSQNPDSPWSRDLSGRKKISQYDKLTKEREVIGNHFNERLENHLKQFDP